ncbi:MAG: VOC family protein [Gracilimonas sp.]|nr:VOC family protein [Gracilimonas sp.]
MEKVIAGIQQIGIGIPDVYKATNWYRKHFGMDIKMFEDAATAELMLPYTGGKPHDRTAILTLNMKGGGGFEIWQYTSRKPQPADFDIKIGDLGINCGKIKSIDVSLTHKEMKRAGLDILTPLAKNPAGEYNFFVKDLYGNIWQVVKGLDFFKTNTPSSTGGVVGAVIGSTDIEEARKLYSEVLGYDQIIYDETRNFTDLDGLPGGKDEFRRVLLRHSKPRQGGFSNMFGPTEIELIEVKGREPRKIYKDRYWGDLGFIHLCFDVQGMDALEKELGENGFPFTVDSANSFDMGEAAGRFTYVEDPDGTLIEFVETHKVPIIKKIGWYIDMTKRDPTKNLPNWMISALRFSRMKSDLES